MRTGEAGAVGRVVSTIPPHPLARAAYHEGGHAIAALHFRLPLREVVIHTDGSGLTSYCPGFGLAECEPWTIVTFCGGEAELDMFGDRRADNGDLCAIDAMLERLRLDWDENKLTELRYQARRLGVIRKRTRMRSG